MTINATNTGSTSAHRTSPQKSARPAWLALAQAETKLVVRNKAVMLTALGMPIIMGLFFTQFEFGSSGASSIIAMQVMMSLLFTVFLGSTMTLVSRRQQLLLKRFKFAPASPTSVVTGLLLPLSLMAIAQIAVLAFLVGVLFSSVPERIDLIILNLLVSIPAFAAMGFATAAFTRDPEGAQYTTLPGAMVIALGIMMAMFTPVGDLHWIQILAPGGAMIELVRLGWDGAQGVGVPYIASLLGANILWAAGFSVLAAYTFSWHPKR